MMDAFIIGFLISLAVVLYAFHKEALNTSGSFSALVVGTLIYGFGGWASYVPLMLFFIPASFIAFTDTEDEGRSARQVIAKSIIGLFFTMLFFFLEDSIWLLFMTASFAGAAADTWSSIIGKQYGQSPVILPTFKRVKKGTPGGITLYGILGAVVVAFAFGLYQYVLSGVLMQIVIVFFTGILTALIDSLLNTLRQKQDPERTSKRFHFFDSEFMNFLSNALAMLTVPLLITWLL